MFSYLRQQTTTFKTQNDFNKYLNYVEIDKNKTYQIIRKIYLSREFISYGQDGKGNNFELKEGN